MNRPYFLKISILCTLLNTEGFVLADQPIMNEVPRWDGGFGIQIFQEFQWSNDLMRGSRDLSNPFNLRYEKLITHFEGVYTWHKWVRITAKLPWVDQKRRVIDQNGVVRTQKNSGFDDAKLALPLRYYINEYGYSGHVGIVPQIRFGGNDDGLNRISDGSTDYGMSVTFERETAGIKFSGDITYWWEQGSQQRDDWSIDIEISWNFHDRGSINLETEYIEDPDDFEWLGFGPTMFWNFNDVILGRIEYKFAVQEQVNGTSLSRGDSFRIGLGAVF